MIRIRQNSWIKSIRSSALKETNYKLKKKEKMERNNITNTEVAILKKKAARGKEGINKKKK